MPLIRPSFYVNIVRYHQRAFLKVFTEAILVTTLIITAMLLASKYYRQKIVDFIIVGTGRYPGIVGNLLEGRGYRCQSILPACLHQVSLPINDLSGAWCRLSLSPRYIPIIPQSTEQLKPVAESFGINLEIFQECQEELIKISEEGLVDLFKLPTNQCHRDEILSCCFEDGFMTITTLSGLVLKSRYLIFTQTTYLSFIQKYLDFQRPRQATLELTGKTTHQQQVALDFHPEIGVFSLKEELTLSEETSEVFPISLSFPLRSHLDPVMFLDTLHLESEQRLLMIMMAIAKFLPGRNFDN